MSLFEPFDLDGLRLANRIVMAPMTRSRVGTRHEPTVMTCDYYAQRSSAGLIVSEAIVVSPEARGYLFTPGLYDDAQEAAWGSVVRAVHSASGRIFAQLWHCGRVSHTSVLPSGAEPLSATDEHVAGLSTFGLRADGTAGGVTVSPPKAMTVAQIDRTIQEFADAAVRAQRAGFDGVEILAANGYVFEQFLNSACNTRTDLYGGDPAGRTRLLLRTFDAIRAAVGADFPVAVRLSPFAFFNSMPADPEVRATYLFLAGELEKRRVAYVHFNDEPVSLGHLNDDEQVVDAAPQRLIPPDFSLSFRDIYSGPVVLCGGLDRPTAETFLAAGAADLAAFGVPFIANPDLPQRLRNDWPLSEPKLDLFYGGAEPGYVDYPAYEESHP